MKLSSSEIYWLANDVLLSITNNLNNGIYSDLNGELKFGWGTDRSRCSARAFSYSATDNPPKHKIVIDETLALRLYEDAANYRKFLSDVRTKNLFAQNHNGFEIKPHLFEDTPIEESVKNIFFGALTWISYHGLGHLIQENGYIKKSFTGKHTESCVDDCNASEEIELTEREAIISHVTELAADVEAMQLSASSIFIQAFHKHLTKISDSGPDEASIAEIQKDSKARHEFQENLCSMTAGLAITLYRFNEGKPYQPTASAIKSHPTPLRRLEHCLTNLFEGLDAGGQGMLLHGLNREQLVMRCTGSAFGVFICNKIKGGTLNIDPDSAPIVRGILEDPYLRSYWRDIINAWDEVKGEVSNVRRFGVESGQMDFSPELRAKIFAG